MKKRGNCLKQIWVEFCYNHRWAARECCRIRCSAETLCAWLEEKNCKKTKETKKIRNTKKNKKI